MSLNVLEILISPPRRHKANLFSAVCSISLCRFLSKYVL
jgi:hypothetical protein